MNKMFVYGTSLLAGLFLRINTYSQNIGIETNTLRNVAVAWNYPVSEFNTNVIKFRIYHTNNVLPIALADFSTTNLVAFTNFTLNGIEMASYSNSFKAAPYAYKLIITAINVTGLESVPSPVLEVSGAPRVGELDVKSVK